MIFLASDHAGYELKEKIKKMLQVGKEEVEDLGCHSPATCDYPDYGHKMAVAMLEHPGKPFGIAICGTGAGMSIVLNRHIDIRAAKCSSEEEAALARRHNNANILVLGGWKTGLADALTIVNRFLDTPFEQGRHLERIRKIDL